MQQAFQLSFKRHPMSFLMSPDDIDDIEVTLEVTLKKGLKAFLSKRCSDW
jgi:hypothetical protein